MSTAFVSLSIEGTIAPARAMLSVRDTAIAEQKVSPEFEQCSCSVPLVLSNTVLFLYDQVADIRPRQTSGVVTTLTGNPPHNTHSSNPSTLRLCCLFRYCMQYSATCDVLIVQVMYRLRNTSVQCHVQNACYRSQT